MAAARSLRRLVGGKTIKGMAIEVELSPVACKTGVLFVNDVDLADTQPLAVGADVDVRDEGGHVHKARVEATRPARFGTMYRLRLLRL